MSQTDNTVHVLGFAGSLRKQSYNRALLRNAQAVLPEGISLEIFELDDIPVFNVDVEAEGIPDPVLAFREAIKAADALLIATPEYNFSIPGVLKNAIDWASRKRPDGFSPLDEKPVAIIGAGGAMGTLRAQMHLRDILLHNDMRPLGRPAFMVARAWQQFDDDGNLKDEDLRARLRQVLVALRDWTRLLQK